MPMEPTVRQIVAEVMRELAYGQRNHRWYKDMGEVLRVVDLQKSPWGDYNYLNLAIWAKFLGENRNPPVPKCHIICRADSLPDAPGNLDAALNEEDYWRMDSDHRREVIKLALCNGEFMFFRNLTCVAEVKKFIQSPESRRIAVKKSLRDALGVPIP
jgi:hypothetical protein